LVGEPEVFSTA